MKYIRTEEGIFDEIQHRHTKIKGRVSIMGVFYDFKEADTIEELIQVGDIVFYYDFHSQKEQCMYIQDLIFARELNITKLLIPVEDDYKCVAKAEHRYLEIDSMKQIVEKGELELI